MLVARRVSLDWQVAAAALLLGIGNGMLHWQAIDRQWLDWQAQEHVRMLAGTFYSPDQYRILTFLLADGLVRLGLPIHSAHEVWRVIFTSASLFVLYRFARGWFSPMLSLTAMFMLATALPLTYVYYMMQVADPLNMLVFFLAFWAMRDGRDGWLIPLVCIGMFNRESPLAIPVFYAALRWGSPWRHWVPVLGVTALLAVSIYIGLRIAYGPKELWAYANDPLEHLRVNFTDWRAYVDLLGVLNIALWGGWVGWRRRPEFLRRMTLVVPLFLVPYLLFGTLREARYYLPVLCLLIPMALFYLLDVIRSEEPSGMLEGTREPSHPRRIVTAAKIPATMSK